MTIAYGSIAPLDVEVEGARGSIVKDYRGQYPETWGLTFLGTIGVNAGDILYTSPDVSMYSVHEFQGVTSGVFTVEVSLDGTNYSGAVALEDGASATPATRVVVSANLTSIYTVYGKFAAVRVKQSGATAANVRGRHAIR